MNNKNQSYNLSSLAFQAMQEKGFFPDFSEDIIEQLNTINSPASSSSDLRYADLTNKLWVSIDNDDSRDLDQLTYAESLNDSYKIYVAVADVDSLVKIGTPIDRHASNNTTSVYTPTKVFPMLPLKLSTNLTSLNENEKRCAIVIESTVSKNGSFQLNKIYPAFVLNVAKLTYNGVSSWLDKRNPYPEHILSIPGLQEQLILQDAISVLIREFRQQSGALDFKTLEVNTILDHGVPVGLQEAVTNRAHRLIENFMIASNVAMTKFMIENNLPVLRRVVRTPERWDRIVALAMTKGTQLPSSPDVKALQQFLEKEHKSHPDDFYELSLSIIKLIGRGEYVITSPDDPSIGHFDLALADYSHTTAPNRRFPDLIMQRILKSHLKGVPLPYNHAELTSLATHCTQKEDDATKVERKMRKSAAAMVLSNMIGQEFSALVTGSTDKGTWVRLFKPPIEGKLVEGYQDRDVGDHLKVKLVHVDIPKGFIDFVAI